MQQITDKGSNIATLIKKYTRDELTESDRILLMNWISESDENHKVFNELVDEKSLRAALKELYLFEDKYMKNQPSKFSMMAGLGSNKTSWFKYIIAAACVIAVVCLAWLFLFNNKKSDKRVAATIETNKAIQDIPPGGNKAVLTLADGSVITLDNAKDGMIAEQGKTTITKTQNGELEYKASVDQAPQIISYNTISTPRGGQYQLTLPDGSKVWLNAASSLKFPVSFTGKERKVQLIGEAYFEVAHVNMPGSKDGMPFEVELNSGMKVQVLGTHFNVMAYEDEKEVKTTLLEGKVKVINDKNQEALLEPGQQAQLSKANGSLQVQKDANIGVAVAWKDGQFNFVRADLKSVMRQLARWYDVQIEFDKSVPEKSFSGEISRRLNASEVLSVIEFTGVHFRIEGKKIKILP